MADYDVSAVGLAVPANPAPLDTYTPAVTVRNNGLYAAIATGTIQAYKAGVLVYASTLLSPSIQPGQTGLAIADDEWTPDEETDYTFYGYVTTQLDQVEPNNNLAPTTVEISGTPPPPPVTVPAHAQQHQAGGADELSVEQLPGILADAQTPADHASSHQVGGADMLNVAGLSGKLAEAQEPDPHGNEAHTPDMATAADLTTHANGTLRHAQATNLANRETSGPDTGLLVETQLVKGTVVPDPGDDPLTAGLRVDRYYGPTNPVHHASKHEPGGLDEIAMPAVANDVAQNIICTPAGGQMTLATAQMTAAQVKPFVVADFYAVGNIAVAAGPGQSVVFTVFYQNGGASLPLCAATFPVTGGAAYTFFIEASAGIYAGLALAALLNGDLHQVGAPAGEIHADAGAAAGLVAVAQASRFFLAVSWTGGRPGSTLTASNTFAHGSIPA